MEMKDIQRFTIVAGPNDIAYHFYPTSKELVVWVGDYVENAPLIARKSEILPGMEEWSMEDREEDEGE